MVSIVDDLILMNCIASGCFAQTFLSKKQNSNIIYATKKIDINDINREPQLKNYLVNEINFLKEVNHKNIIKLYEVKKTNDSIYLIMEYCNGGTLLNTLNYYKAKNGKPFSEEIVQYFMKQILMGVESLHNHGIIHHDLKLDNILLKYNPNNLNLLSSEIKIIDFNISTRTRKFINNEMPEKKPFIPIMFNDDESDDIYDEKVDIWSLGLLCYEMLFGEKLLDQNNIYTKKINIIIPQTISLKAQTFLLSMLQKNGNKRLSATELLNHEFIANNKYNNIFYNIDRNSYFTPDNKSKYKTFFEQKQINSNKNGNYSHKMQPTIQFKNLLHSNKSETRYKPFFNINKTNNNNNNTTTSQLSCTLFSRGKNFDKNEIKIIVNCCVNSYKQTKEKKYMAMKVSRDLKRLLGNNWTVSISDLKFNPLDFGFTYVNKDDFLSFSYENLLFKICRYY